MKFFLKVILIVLTTIFVGCSATNVYENKVNKMSKNEMISEIEKNNKIESERIGFNAEKSKQLIILKRLLKTTNEEERYLLTSHKNNVVKYYAFLALMESKSNKVYGIIKSNLYNDDDVTIQNGCITYKIKLIDIMIEEGIKSLNESEKAELNKMILENDLKIKYKEYLIRNLEKNEENYKIIRTYALKNDESAMISLAEYKNQQDISIILDYSKQSIRTTFMAMERFPNEIFLNFLIEYYNKLRQDDHFNESYNEDWYYLYQAIAVYKNEKSNIILSSLINEDSLNQMSINHSSYILFAAFKYKTEKNNELLFKIFEKYGQINNEVFDYLYNIDKNRLLKESKKRIENRLIKLEIDFNEKKSIEYESKIELENKIKRLIKKEKI